MSRLRLFRHNMDGLPDYSVEACDQVEATETVTKVRNALSSFTPADQILLLTLSESHGSGPILTRIAEEAGVSVRTVERRRSRLKSAIAAQLEGLR